MSAPGRSVAAFALACLGLLPGAPARSAPAPLPVTLDYRVLGAQLRPARTSLAIPKNVAGAIGVSVVAADGSSSDATRAVAEGAIVEATLRGPSFPARRVVGLPGGDLELPPLPLVGDYSLDEIRLVDATTGAIRLEGTPKSVPIVVFDEVLVSRVTSRPLTLGEIQEKGIFLDEKNFRAVEFQVGFVVDGQTVQVRFPVVSPKFTQSTEIVPRAELEELLKEAQSVNSALALGAELPPALRASGLDIEIKGINFQFVEPTEGPDLALSVPPIPGLLVIPGRIGLLNQFFSVQLFTENAAPAGSGLSVHTIRARLVLPPGPDQRPGTYDAPGDDPIRFARVGANAEIQPIQPVRALGPDGVPGTADDVERLQPGETGQAEFLVEGLAEGLHVMDVTLEAALDGLGSRTRAIRGEASGAVLVRNPKFSLAFGHPRTIRSGEPYSATVTVLNTSTVPANLVSVRLPSTSLSGAVFEAGQSDTIELGTILPGETRIGSFRLRSQRTGGITFSQLKSDGDITGRFQLSMGVDERGVELSPDAIGYPAYVDDLRAAAPELFAALERYLGQGLSVATAGQLPPGVTRVARAALQQRIVELAEAGQRLRYGDVPERVFSDLLLDLLGARLADAGLDQILRTTEAGRELRVAAFRAARSAGVRGAAELLAALAPDLAGRGEAWRVAATSAGAVEPVVEEGAARADLLRSSLASAAGFEGAADAGREGHWAISRPGAGQALRFDVVAPAGAFEVAVLALGTDGTGRLLRFALPATPAGTCLRLAPEAPETLRVDEGCDGSVERSVPASGDDVAEVPPRVLAAIQDVDVAAGRPAKYCVPPFVPYENYGQVVAVLFSKPMRQAGVDVPGAFRLDDGNAANFVQIQPGGRVALLNLARGIGTLRARTLSLVGGVTDPRGNPLGSASLAIDTVADQGVSVAGRAVKGNGEPAPGIPVTLTLYEEVQSGPSSCVTVPVRVSQVLADAGGRFQFDFVVAGLPYSLSATDTSGLSAEASAAILEAAREGAVDREKLLETASDPATRDTLLGAFAVGALPEAIALAEGLDRALVRDLVPPGSARVGSEVPVALRFRGRGTVSGIVLAADGVTPVASAAVNLFPDPDSRELGRGVFSDAKGRFAFFGVPLGPYSIEAVSPNGQARTIAGVLATPGEVREERIVLSSAVVERSAIEGQVLETGSVAGHAGARVYVGKFLEGRFGNVVAALTADGEGFFRAGAVPSGIWDLVAVSQDGRRQGERRGVQSSAATVSRATLVLQGRVTVRGRVEFADGRPAPFALVAGGEGIVRADAAGFFTLPGVPTGSRSIEAGLEKNPDAGIDFTRLGSAGVNVVAGVESFVVVKLRPAGRVVGRVVDAAGRPMPHVRVAIPRPQENGFLWVEADENGNYEFENLPLDDYTVSAPGPAVAETDVSSILDTLAGNPSAGDLQAAITKAFEIFTGVNDPLLNGQGASFSPGSWGFTKTSLDFDGQTVVANVQFLPTGTVSGTVLNGQGVPIGARVRLTGIGPTNVGDVGFQIRGEGNSDPATGVFSFAGAAMVGDYGVQAASPFFPNVISTSGRTTRIDPDATGLVLQFPDEDVTHGGLAGTVLDPEGRLVGDGVEVKISFGDLQITTEGGRFDTNFDLPAVNARGERITYVLEARDPVTQLRGQALATLTPGQKTEAQVRLLGKGGLVVEVRDAAGAPVAEAAVEVDQATFPGERFSGTTDGEGKLRLGGLFEGFYSARARKVVGATAVLGSAGVSVAAGGEATARVTLAASGTLRGRFLAADRETPIPDAQVGVAGVGFATTGADGRFELVGVPLGSFLVRAQDPVNGRAAAERVTLSSNGQVVDVALIVRAVGEITGAVIASSGGAFVPAASVTLELADGLTPARTVSSDPSGFFSFPGVPAGAFTIRAVDPVSQRAGAASGVLPEGLAQLRLDVPLAPVASLTVSVLEADGATPAAGATVQMQTGIGTVGADAGSDGRVTFGDLPLGDVTILARSNRAGRTRSIASRTLRLASPGAAPEVRIVLGGVGRVEGRLFASDGTTPLAGREVTLAVSAPLVRAEVVAATGPEGAFAFGDVPVGDFRLLARDVALAASESGRVAAEGETVTVDLVLGPSGRVRGRLVRADGAEPVAGADVALSFQAPSGALGRAVSRTPADGAFAFEAIPVGAVFLESIVPARSGIARRSLTLTANAEEIDLGDVRLDEADPRVVAVFPAVGAQGVPTEVVARITLSETLDPDLVDPRAVFLRTETGRIETELTLAVDPGTNEARILELRPLAPLASETDHEIVVLDGEVRDALGSVIAQGPRDLVGRSLIVPFVSPFRTRDDDPPGLLSLTPAPASEQVDPRAVIRLSFDESIAAGSVVEVAGPAGDVPGRTDLGVGGRVVVFTPAAFLEPNAVYTARIRSVQDLAGNLAEGDPSCAPDLYCTTFATLDTLGPVLASFGLQGGAPPVAGAAVVLVASLATAEPGARIRVSADLVPIAESAAETLFVPFTLPGAGTVVLRATAIDRFGNEGPIFELPVRVQENQPPSVAFRRVSPESGPVPTGTTVVVEVSASDDAGIREIRASGAGAISRPLLTSAGAPILLSGLVPASTPAGRPVRILAQAFDQSGASSGEQVLEIPVSDATPPEAAVLSPAAGSLVRPGEAFEVVVRGRDAFGVTRLGLDADGIVTLSASQAVDPAETEALRAFSVLVPADAAAGGEITLQAAAQDAAGNARGSVPVTVRVADILPPQVLLVDPADGAEGIGLRPTLRVVFSEPLSPASVSAVSVVLLPESGPAPALLLTLSPDGTELTARPETSLAPETRHVLSLAALLTDLAGNPLPVTASAFTTGPADTRAPRLVSLEPADGAVGVALRPVLRAIFDEPVSRASVGQDGLRLALLDAAGGELPVTATTLFESDDSVIRLELPADLAPAARHALVLSGALTDLAGNAVADADGAPIGTGRRHVFTTGGLVLTAPAPGARVVEGQALTLSAEADAGLGLDTVVFTGNAADLATDATPPFSAEITVPTLQALGGDPALRLGARGLAAGAVRALSPEITVAVNADGDDADADGLTNGDEIRAGTDPFRDDAAEDPDEDGLSNAEEIALGTRVDAADSDGDGLSDFTEARVTGTDPRKADSDGDGIPDGLDLASGPRLLSVEPADGAVGVSVRPTIRVRFDEPLDVASVTPARARLLAPAATPVAVTLGFSEGDRVLEIRPAAALAFETRYELELSPEIREPGGPGITESDGGALRTRSFSTGSFGITAPAAGEAVLERAPLSVQVAGSAALGIASVELQRNGGSVGTDAEAPFAFETAVPPIADGSSLTLVAIARDGAGAELARDTVILDVIVGLRAERRLLGVPLGGSAPLRLLLRAPQAEDLPVTLEVGDPATLGAPDGPFVLRAGETVLEIPLTGLAEGGSSLVARSARDVVDVHVSVSPANEIPVFTGTPPPDAAPAVFASPAGVALQTFPSAGLAVVPAGGSATLEVLLLAAPAAGSTPVSVTSSDPQVAAVESAALVEAGSRVARVRVDAGSEGEAVILLRAGALGRELRVRVGPPVASATLPSVAPPVGVAVLPLPSAGVVLVSPAATRTLTVRLFDAPVAGATPVSVTSSDPAVARAGGSVVVPAGSTDALLVLETGVAGQALLTLRAGDVGRELEVVVGIPPADRRPIAVGPPLGVVVLPLPSAGEVIVAESGLRTLRFRLFDAPVASDTEVQVSSSDAAVARAGGTAFVPAGSTDVVLPLETGVAGRAVLLLRAGDVGRELTVVVGAPEPGRAPLAAAPPVGIAVLPLPSAGDVILREAEARTLRIRILDVPSLLPTPLEITSSDPSVASVSGTVFVPAGSLEAEIPVESGAAGEATLVLRAGDAGRELRILVGPIPAERRPVIFAPPLGAVVLEDGFAGTLFLDPGETRSLTVRLFSFPSLVDLPVTATSDDPAVALVSPEQQLLATGTRDVVISVSATATSRAATRVVLRFGAEVRTLKLHVGGVDAALAPDVLAPPVGIGLSPPPPGGGIE